MPRWAVVAIEIDGGMLDYMRGSSGAIEVEVRGADIQLAVRGLEEASREIARIPHPEQPDHPYASFTSPVEVGPRGPSVWFDMADAEVYDGLLEGVLHMVLAALDAVGLLTGVVTWPEGSARTRMPPRGAEALREAWDAFVRTIDLPNPTGDDQGGWRAPRDDLPSQAKGWSRGAAVPTPRNFLAACTGPDGRTYAIGGECRRPVKTVEAYDAVTDRWRKVASLRLTRRSPGAALGSDGRVYAVGGYGAMQADGVTNVEALDVAANRWEPAAPMVSKAYNDMAATTGLDGRIYAVASGDVSGPNVLEAYDAQADHWTPLSPPPGSYRNFVRAVAAPNGHIYVFGAERMGVEAYDPQVDGWVNISPPRHPRLFFGAALGGDGRIYAMGGLGQHPFTTVEAYDVGADRWVEADPMPEARAAMALTGGPGGTILAIGGYGGDPYDGSDGLVGPTDIYVP